MQRSMSVWLGGLAAAAVLSTVPTSARPTTAGYFVEPIVAERATFGDGRYVLFEGRIGLQSLNNLGQIGLAARVSESGRQTGGLFVVSKDGATAVAEDVVSEFDDSGFDESYLSLNDAGQGVFRATHGINAPDYYESISLFDGASTREILRSGDSVGGVTVRPRVGTSFEPTINARGDVALVVADANDQNVRELLVYSGGRFERRLGSFDAAPNGRRFGGPFEGITVPWITDTGDVAIPEQTDGGANGRDHGIYAVGPEGASLVAATDKIPGSGFRSRKNTYATGTMNESRVVAYRAYLAGDGPRVGVFAADANGTRAIALAGDRAPGGGRYDFSGTEEYSFYYYPIVNTFGNVAFRARVARGDGEPVEAIFVATADGDVRRVVAVGDELPNGKTVRGFAGFSFNDVGQVAFYAVGEGLFLATPQN